MAPTRGSRDRVPWRTILACVGTIAAVVVGYRVLGALHRIIIQLIIACFLAAVLNPAVDRFRRRGLPRGVAVGLVFLIGLTVATALAYLFIHPIYVEGQRLAHDLPNMVADARKGNGTIGKLIQRYHLQQRADDLAPRINDALTHAGGPALSILSRLAAGLLGLVTILVLTFLILLEAPGMVENALATLPDRSALRIRRVAADVGRSVSGYVAGNVATSLVAGAVCGTALLITGVPFAFVFAVWVGLVDLLPLVGGLMAGVPTVAFATIHSVRSGVIVLITFLVYQQVENHVLNPLIMSRTVKLNPLWVILAVLIGAELAGFVGALLAIPAAGTVQVIARDIWDQDRGRLKSTPTIGDDEQPA